MLNSLFILGIIWLGLDCERRALCISYQFSEYETQFYESHQPRQLGNIKLFSL